MTYQIKTIKSQTQFEKLVDSFSTLQYWIGEVYDKAQNRTAELFLFKEMNIWLNQK